MITEKYAFTGIRAPSLPIFPRHLDAEYSRFRHLTHSNVVPSEVEVREVETIISREVHELSVLEPKIKELQASLDKLLQERAQRSAYLKAFKVTLSPVRRLPPELVSAIFRLACSERYPLPPPSDFRPPHLTVSQICSGWRKVALGLSRLFPWNRVLLCSEDKKGPTTVNEARLQHIETFLSHAGSLPLDIQLIDRWEDHSLFNKILLPRVGQCSKIDLCVGPKPIQLLSKLPPGSLDLLESLRIDCQSYDWIPTPVIALYSPNLRRLVLERFKHLLPLNVSFPRLTYLRVECDYTDLETLLRVLRTSVDLLKCRLNIKRAAITGYTEANPDKIILPRLHTLRLDVLGSDAYYTTRKCPVTPLLRFLVLPALKELQMPFVTRAYDRSSQHEEAFTSLATRSSFTLDKLSFVHAHFPTKGSLERILRVTPSLTSLSIDGVADSASMIALARYDVVPHLTSLHMACSWRYLRDWLAIIKSRRSRGPRDLDGDCSSPNPSRSQLKSIKLTLPDIFKARCWFSDHYDATLHSWRRKGLEVELTFLDHSKIYAYCGGYHPEDGESCWESSEDSE